MESLIIGAISLVISVLTSASLEKKANNFKRIVVRLFSSIFSFVLALLIYAFAFKFLHFEGSYVLMIITTVYAIFEWDSVFPSA